MAVFFIVGIIVVLIACWRLYAWRERNERLLPSWLSNVRGTMDAIAWGSSGLLFLLVGSGVRGVALQVIALIAVLSAWGAWLAARQLAAIRRENLSSLRVLVASRWRRRWHAASSAVRRAAQIVSPAGSRDIRISFDLMDHLFDFRVFFRLYGLVLIVLPVVVSVAVAGSLNTGSVVQVQTVRALIGYNSLAVVSCMTAAVVMTVLFQALLRIVGIVRYRIDLPGMFKAVAAWTGYGTAMGLVAAALLPVTARIMPTVASPSGAVGAAGLTPQLLVDIPAACAILGYACGIVVAVIEASARARNLFVRRFVTPVVFLGAVSLLVGHGFAPRDLVERVAELTTPSPAVCTEAAFEPHLQDASWLLHAMHTCGTQIYLDSSSVLWVVESALLLGSVLAFVGDFRKRAASDSDGSRGAATAPR